MHAEFKQQRREGARRLEDLAAEWIIIIIIIIIK